MECIIYLIQFTVIDEWTNRGGKNIAIGITLVDGRPTYEDVMKRNLILAGVQCAIDLYDRKKGNNYKGRGRGRGRGRGQYNNRQGYNKAQNYHYKGPHKERPVEKEQFKTESVPEEKRLKLNPRTKPLDDSNVIVEDRKNIFGGAKPREENISKKDTKPIEKVPTESPVEDKVVEEEEKTELTEKQPPGYKESYHKKDSRGRGRGSYNRRNSKNGRDNNKSKVQTNKGDDDGFIPVKKSNRGRNLKVEVAETKKADIHFSNKFDGLDE